MSKCESCGADWTDPLGITGTCKRVQEQASEIARLKAEVAELETHRLQYDPNYCARDQPIAFSKKPWPEY